MRPTRILVVEDTAVVAMNIKDKLNTLGYEVTAIVPSGEEALQHANETLPDLVLMDIFLSGELDGIETANQLRAKFDIPIIYLTGLSDEDIIERAKLSGPFGYLVKPFKPQDLRTTIEIAIYKNKIDQELSANRKWLAATLNSICDAVIATDAQGRIKFLNPVAETLTGWQQSEADGVALSRVFRIMDAVNRQPLQDPAQVILDGGKAPGLPEKNLLVTNDGREIPIEDSAAPILNEQGKIEGVVLTFRDLSEQQRIEKALTKSQKLASIGTLTAGVAHEIKSPLQAITLATEGLLRRLEDNEVNEALLESRLEAINRNSWRIADISSSLLNYARASNEERQVCNVNAIVKDTLTLIEHQLAVWNNIQVLNNLREDLPLIHCERNKISQVLINLLTNARDAMPSGGDIMIHSTVSRNHVVLEVVDSGSGIPSELQEKIFDPFFTTKNADEGSGLGLSIVRDIMRSHDGEVKLYSTPNQGTTVALFFPIPTNMGRFNATEQVMLFR